MHGIQETELHIKRIANGYPMMLQPEIFIVDLGEKHQYKVQHKHKRV